MKGKILFLVGLLFFTGCDDNEKTHLREEEKKREAQNAQREIASIEDRFGAVYFPPQEINDWLFTYQVQKFFKDNNERAIVFKGCLEDVEMYGDSTFLVFECPGSLVTFRLIAPENKAIQLVQLKNDDTYRTSSCFFDPDFIVKAKVATVQKHRIYESYESEHEYGIDYEIGVTNDFVATGRLIELQKSNEK